MREVRDERGKTRGEDMRGERWEGKDERERKVGREERRARGGR